MMRTLRLTQTSNGERHQIEIALEGEGVRQTASAQFQFALDIQDHKDLRWYLEDYLEGPADEVTKNWADQIERRLSELGAKLFHQVFESNPEVRDLWATLRATLADTRIEVVADLEGGVLPWELLLDPKTNAPLALRADSFVRSHPQAAQAPLEPERGATAIRVLLVISRTGVGDIPLRSIARHLVRLGATQQKALRLDVLRPPTFLGLQRRLETAKHQGTPYHVVHFDGHGVYVDVEDEQELSKALDIASPMSFSLLSPRRPGLHGFLLFEDPTGTGKVQLVDGPSLGRLLVETRVPVLVLNACRSAHTEATTTPESADYNPHSQVRAYGSLAQEVMDAGLTAVVAMGYNVYVDTAARFMGELYAALVQGLGVGVAGKLARKLLAAQPMRDVGESVTVQDWPVPVVYEAAPIPLVEPTGPVPLVIFVEESGTLPAGALDPRLPPPPDATFIGRDETIFALDRAFDTHQIVVLQGDRGAGKTATAAEFARWYAKTGGVDGPVLFTDFVRYTPLAAVLDQLWERFGRTLEARGWEWRALSEPQRRSVALQVLGQIPVLWVWENVGSVADRPGTLSAWPPVEQEKLADFLREACVAQAKFLLTSRHDEGMWLGELPAWLSLPAMPMRERAALAKAILAKHGQPLGDVKRWHSLLGATKGNPRTITEAVGQIARLGPITDEGLEACAENLRTG